VKGRLRVPGRGVASSWLTLVSMLNRPEPETDRDDTETLPPQLDTATLLAPSAVWGVDVTQTSTWTGAAVVVAGCEGAAVVVAEVEWGRTASVFEGFGAGAEGGDQRAWWSVSGVQVGEWER